MTSSSHLDNIVQMLPVFMRKSSLGIEITATTVRLAAISGTRQKLFIDAAATTGLTDGAACDSFTADGLGDPAAVVGGVRACLASQTRRIRRAHLSLPDALFRVQMLDFDELPDSAADRERLVKWRLEKAATFDLEGTVLRLLIQHKDPKGYAVLACAAKKAVVEQYEQALEESGLEPWSVGISSFHAWNLFSPLMDKAAANHAFAYIMEDSLAVIVTDRGRLKLYRWKDVKRTSTDELAGRCLRELEDTMHFYSHLDRTQTSEVRHLFLAGDPAVTAAIAGELGASLSMSVAAVTPEDAGASGAGSGGALALLSAALGAGSAA